MTDHASTPRPARSLTPRDRVMLVAVLLVAASYGVWTFSFKDDGSAEPAVSVPTVATRVPDDPQGLGWAAAVPKMLPAGVSDATTLDAKEVAPARFRHQVDLLNEAFAKDEQLYLLRVQHDGTLVGLVSDGKTTRWIATKKDLRPDPAQPVSFLRDSRPLEPSDFVDRAPLKLLRAISRAGGAPPNRLSFGHPANAGGAFGDSPTWAIYWAGVNKNLFATYDAHSLSL